MQRDCQEWTFPKNRALESGNPHIQPQSACILSGANPFDEPDRFPDFGPAGGARIRARRRKDLDRETDVGHRGEQRQALRLGGQRKVADTENHQRNSG